MNKHTYHPQAANRFLFLYLLAYLVIGYVGPEFLPEDLTFTILRFFPLLLAIGYLIITGQNPVKALSIKPFHPLSLPLIILYPYLVLPITTIVRVLSQVIARNLVSTEINSTISDKGLLITLVTIALFPAIVEEIVFRGVYYTGIRNKRPLKSILIAAFCFGIMHMNVNQFSYAFVMGIFLILIFEATGSLLAPILVHMLFNGISVLVNYLMKATQTAADAAEIINGQSNLMSTSEAMATIKQTTPAALVGLILAILIIVLLAKLNHRGDALKSIFSPPALEEGESTKIGSLSLYAYLVICVGMTLMILIRFK